MSRTTPRGWSRRRLLALFALSLGSSAHGAETLVTEVLPIGYRRVEELLPVIRPLVPPPGSVGGIYNQLVVKTTPANMAEIKQVLATLDRAPANLLVSVRHTVNEEVRRDLLEASAQLRSGDVSVGVGTSGGAAAGGAGATLSRSDGDSRARIRLLQTGREEDSRDLQSVRVLEGREAFIRAGESVPLPDRQVIVTGAGTLSVQQGVRYEDVDTGFYVLARLSGNSVTVEVAPQRRQRSSSGGGAIDVQSASTVISGPLGRWMEIGSVASSASRQASGTGFSASTTRRDDRSIFIKVDRLP